MRPVAIVDSFLDHLGHVCEQLAFRQSRADFVPGFCRCRIGHGFAVAIEHDGITTVQRCERTDRMKINIVEVYIKNKRDMGY